MDRIVPTIDIGRLPMEQRAAPFAELEPQPGDMPEIVDLKAWRTPVLQSDAVYRERERIIDPQKAGPVWASYKMLRTQVLRQLDKLGTNTLAVVSACANDGKTLTAINLAISIATDPARTVLLVDFDLRNPGVHRKLGMQVRTGVEECLQQQMAVERALVRPAGFDRLTVLPARERVEHSSELLGGVRAGEIVNDLKSRYANRVVLFDLPPVLESDDALAFARHIDAALLVVGEGRTGREDLKRTVELFRDIPIVGTVLNASREEAGRHY